MRVRILSGSQRGALLDLPDAEAMQNISTGFAEAMSPEVPAVAISTTLGPVTVLVPVAAAKAAKARAVKAPPKPAKKDARRRA